MLGLNLHFLKKIDLKAGETLWCSPNLTLSIIATLCAVLYRCLEERCDNFLEKAMYFSEVKKNKAVNLNLYIEHMLLRPLWLPYLLSFVVLRLYCMMSLARGILSSECDSLDLLQGTNIKIIIFPILRVRSYRSIIFLVLSYI